MVTKEIPYFDLDTDYGEISYESAMEQLQTVKGIGKKVANCI